MNSTLKIVVVAALILSVAAVVHIKRQDSPTDTAQGVVTPATQGLPRLVDLGADKCIPCKMMAPVLEELKEQYKDRLNVVFIDVWKDPNAGTEYGIKLIPTQILYDAAGKELFRHEGFFSKEDILAKFREFGVDLPDASTQMSVFERLTPAKPDERPKDTICYLCDGTIDAKTLVTVQTDKGEVRLCGPHCYFILYSCLTEDKAGFEKKVTVTDWATGKPVAISEAAFLSGEEEASGRPWIKAFASKDAAVTWRATSGGSVLTLESLAQKEMSHRCGFCDRACYPQDAAEVTVEGGVRTWGCCSHCALGVAARTGKNIEVREKDRLTKEPIVVKTFEGKVASLEPVTAVAWFGQRQKPDGAWASAGCFHQGFFTNADNLKKWVEQNPSETGRLIPISQALADKMKLSPEQIQKACRIGECVPK
ncbi:MAG: thioredoxin fold domain-containing protein [Phycisphaerae bacterium]|nr:thioredoxin fold domain-containing protein [Phycisphaerae bacterium]